MKESEDWNKSFLVSYIDLPYKLQVINGWDRWNFLQQYQDFVLEEYHLGVIYGAFVLRIGANDGELGEMGVYLLAGSVLTWKKDRLIHDNILINYKKIPVFFGVKISIEL
ncbi:hypothetical protein ACFL1Y_01915 [Patescibacteria group bacterium]